jgi:hypothetical protein
VVVVCDIALWTVGRASVSVLSRTGCSLDNLVTDVAFCRWMASVPVVYVAPISNAVTRFEQRSSADALLGRATDFCDVFEMLNIESAVATRSML